MKHINQSYLAYLSKVVVAATFVAMFSPTAYAYKASGSSTNAAQTIGNSTSQQLLANDSTREEVETTRSTTIRRRTVTTERRNQVISSSDSVKGKSSGFNLAVWQPAGNFSEVITRISVKGKRGKGYLKERFLGDYKYKIKQKAKFVKGLRAGDRVIVRLYDTQNNFIGYSEFECLTANTTVNLILSGNPSQYQVVRTVYGVDANSDGKIDTGSTSYDYFTQVSNERVSFLSSSQVMNVSEFQVQGWSAVPATSVYPTSFTQGEYTLVRQSINAFSYNLASALKARPGELVDIVQVSDDSSSVYNVSQMMMMYREIGVDSTVPVKFGDVSENHWAKDFIAELAALQIIQGFPDGSFRPDEQLTRAQFAAMLSQAFDQVKVRNPVSFKDVSTSHWAYNSIREAYSTGFLSVSGNKFNPGASLSRLEVLLTIARGLNYTFSGSTETILAAYTDVTSIRSDVRNAIAALTQRGIVVNYPNVQTLNADKVATRAEVTALIYKSLVSTGEVADISSQYAVERTQRSEVLDQGEIEVEDKKPRRHCNQGIGNGAEGCDPGNSHPHGGSNDEGGRTPGGKR